MLSPVQSRSASLPEDLRLALAQADLTAGRWPTATVIGTRIKTFPLPLRQWARAGQSVRPNEFARLLKRTTFTSLGGERLLPKGRLPTGKGMAEKWYFVKAPSQRIYAFHASPLHPHRAFNNAQQWAAHLRNGGPEPRFLPTLLGTDGFTMGTEYIHDGPMPLPCQNTWFYFTVEACL